MSSVLKSMISLLARRSRLLASLASAGSAVHSSLHALDSLRLLGRAPILACEGNMYAHTVFAPHCSTLSQNGCQSSQALVFLLASSNSYSSLSVG